jgi:ubiquinone/menaquinone biosynthesis C-methylase UbiE
MDQTDLLAHYASGYETERLDSPAGRLEFLRTLEILGRYLPAPPARILDVGGGPGRYAKRLLARGYEVHLVDPVPVHVEAARAALQRPELASAGDARQLEFVDDSVDALLMLGPLYHLTQHEDRIRALTEAARVTRPGGPICCAAISRYASLCDGLHRDLIADPAFHAILQGDLADGQHRNPTDNPEYFTTTFFHRPEELRAELEEAGLAVTCLVGVEGPAWIAGHLEERVNDPKRLAQLLELLRRVEAEPALLGVSAHLLAVAVRAPASDRRGQPR